MDRYLAAASELYVLDAELLPFVLRLNLPLVPTHGFCWSNGRGKLRKCYLLDKNVNDFRKNRKGAGADHANCVRRPGDFLSKHYCIDSQYDSVQDLMIN